MVCVVGLGFVGLPLAHAFSKSLQVIGYDTDSQWVSQIVDQGYCRQNPGTVLTSDVRRQEPAAGPHSLNATLSVTTSPDRIGRADFVLICVPTPLTASKEPDLSHVRAAAQTVGRNMKPGAVVVLESSVFPGVTEEVVKPLLEQESGFVCGDGFRLGYSPERVNPGDEEHTVDKAAKIVAGTDSDTTSLLVDLYSRVTTRVVPAKDIRTAEAAKLTENIQRDMNIALMNELAIIFNRMGIRTKDVIEAASSKWNFHPYSPGLVGGYCIPVNPYFLLHRARELGCRPQVIPAARAVNERMPAYIAEMTAAALTEVGKALAGSRVLVMGLAYKENVAFAKDSPAVSVIRELEAAGAAVYSYDPLVADGQPGFAIKVVDLSQVSEVDAILVCMGHEVFRGVSLPELRAITGDRPVLIDVRGFYGREEAGRVGFHYWSL